MNPSRRAIPPGRYRRGEELPTQNISLTSDRARTAASTQQVFSMENARVATHPALHPSHSLSLARLVEVSVGAVLNIRALIFLLFILLIRPAGFHIVINKDNLSSVKRMCAGVPT